MFQINLSLEELKQKVSCGDIVIDTHEKSSIDIVQALDSTSTGIIIPLVARRLENDQILLITKAHIINSLLCLDFDDLNTVQQLKLENYLLFKISLVTNMNNELLKLIS